MPEDGGAPPQAERATLRELVEQYARAADRRDGELFADAFTEDGVLVATRGEVRGREELRAVPARLAKYTETQHLVEDHEVSLVPEDDDRAEGRTRCVARHYYDIDAGPRVYVMTIRYDDEYHRVAGRWKIATRRLVLLAEVDRAQERGRK